ALARGAAFGGGAHPDHVLRGRVLADARPDRGRGQPRGDAGSLPDGARPSPPAHPRALPAGARRRRARLTPLDPPPAPHDLWCAFGPAASGPEPRDEEWR